MIGGSTAATTRPLAGVFVGGASARMGGRPKGLLEAPDGVPIAARNLELCFQVGLTPMLVGRADAYANIAPGVERLADDPAGIGPIGGLRALVRRARTGDVVVLACDMPYLTKALLERLVAHTPGADAVAARNAQGLLEPFLCRMRAGPALAVIDERIARGSYSVRGVLEALIPNELELSQDELARLVDWDYPHDVR